MGGVIKNFVGGFKKTDLSLSAFYFFLLTSQPHLHLFPSKLKKKERKVGEREKHKKNYFIILKTFAEEQRSVLTEGVGLT